MYNSSPYGYNGYRANGGRMWSMPPGVSSGMSRYPYVGPDNQYNGSLQRMHVPMSTHRGGAYHYSNFMNNMNSNGSAYIKPYAKAKAKVGSAGDGENCAKASTSAQAVQSQEAVPIGMTNLIVNYLPQDMQDSELYNLFRQIGPINTCRIVRDNKSGYSYGYAFVEYSNEADSLDAIKNFNGFNIRNKRLKVSYARPGGDAIKDTNLYVTNLPHNFTDNQLETIFEKFGTILQKNILHDKQTGKGRGVAFVRFNKREEAQAAIEKLQNYKPEGAMQPIGVRLAEEHGKAKAAIYLQQIQVAAVPPPPGITPVYYNTIVHRGRPVKRLPKVHPY